MTTQTNTPEPDTDRDALRREMETASTPALLAALDALKARVAAQKPAAIRHGPEPLGAAASRMLARYARRITKPGLN